MRICRDSLTHGLVVGIGLNMCLVSACLAEPILSSGVGVCVNGHCENGATSLVGTRNESGATVTYSLAASGGVWDVHSFASLSYDHDDFDRSIAFAGAQVSDVITVKAGSTIPLVPANWFVYYSLNAAISQSGSANALVAALLSVDWAYPGTPPGRSEIYNGSVSGVFGFDPLKLLWNTPTKWHFGVESIVGSRLVARKGSNGFISVGANPEAGIGGGTADASHTMTLLGFVAEDEFGNVLTNVTVEGENGFQYPVLAAHLVVPEPASILMLGSGLLGLLTRRRPRRGIASTHEDLSVH